MSHFTLDLNYPELLMMDDKQAIQTALAKLFHTSFENLKTETDIEIGLPQVAVSDSQFNTFIHLKTYQDEWDLYYNRLNLDYYTKSGYEYINKSIFSSFGTNTTLVQTNLSQWFKDKWFIHIPADQISISSLMSDEWKIKVDDDNYVWTGQVILKALDSDRVELYYDPAHIDGLLISDVV